MMHEIDSTSDSPVVELPTVVLLTVVPEVEEVVPRLTELPLVMLSQLVFSAVTPLSVVLAAVLLQTGGLHAGRT